MRESAENFRNEIASKLFEKLEPEQLRTVLAELDNVLSCYEITRKNMSVITTEGLPEVVKYYIASKAVENLSPAR